MDSSPVQDFAVRLRFTDSARKRAESSGIGATLSARPLPGNVQIGDYVSVEHHGKLHRVRVIRRDWIADEGGWTLEITLDHPAR